MRMKGKYLALTLGLCASLVACKKDTTNDDSSDDQTSATPQLRISLEFDASLPRLGNFGEPVTVAAGNAAQDPVMHAASAHYVEFAPDSLTMLGAGAIVYKGDETTAGGENAVDMSKAIYVGNGEEFLSMDLTDLPPGTYEWLRVSLTYQNYDIDYRLTVEPYIMDQDYSGRLASFVGFNNYLTEFKVKDSTVVVNHDKVQGFWAFESGVEYLGVGYGSVQQGEGAGVTVVNPLGANNPVPPGSCVVTGKLAAPLVITGDETEDVEVVLAFSINQSFEWEEIELDGKFEPGIGETVVDMGLRGLHPYVR